jgi:peptidoglycan/xylan/chitin deacetylase (PgdA/CDA1 family)
VFESDASFILFDYFRVPYDRVEAPDGADTVTVRATGERPVLMWPTARAIAANGGRARSFYLGEMRLFGHISQDSETHARLRGTRRDWHVTHELIDRDGRLVAAVLEADDGSTYLPFDPGELIGNFWTERYLECVRLPAMARLGQLARRTYYRARPLLPRSVQMRLRRSFSRVQSRSRFPRWPLETALHDFYDFLFELVSRLTDRPVPFLGLWPHDSSWALVLTHDVEGEKGYSELRKLLEMELEAGYRSSWNFVPQNRYEVEDDLVRELREAGFEIGVHGLRHDGRDLASRATLLRRLPAIRSYAERWQSVGFRSPATLRSAELMPMLGFGYDSSYSDTAPFEPQPGGCCTWLPYMLDELVELPITLPQDHTLFEILGHRDEKLWLEKARYLRDRGGMALLITHPDYFDNPSLLESYRRFLEAFASDSSAWKALPGEVSDWWRRRSESSVQEVEGEWRVVGPVEGEARVEFASAQLQAV